MHCMYTLLNFRTLVVMTKIVMMIMLIITLRMTTITSEAAVTELANIFSN